MDKVKVDETTINSEISKYFSNKLGGNYTFMIMYSRILVEGIKHYTATVLDLNNGGIIRNEERTEPFSEYSDIHIPVLANIDEVNISRRHIYGVEPEVNFDGKRLDLGKVYPNTSIQNEIMSKLAPVMQQFLPTGCIYVTADMMKEFANDKGYESFGFEAHDNSLGKPPIAYCGPEWYFDYYFANPVSTKDFDSSKTR